MDLGLKGRRALVLGASAGLGFAIASELVREGARVAICSRSEERIRAAAANMGAALGVAADLSVPGATRTVMRKKAMPGEDPETLKTPDDVAAQLVPLLAPANTANGQLFSYQA